MNCILFAFKGGLLYQVGGFSLPFFSVGGVQLFFFFIAFFTFPDVDSDTNTSDSEKTLPMLNMLRIPTFVITLMLLLFGAASIGFLQPCIELHLMPLKLSPVELGLILLSPSLLYILISPIVGILTDKVLYT